MEHAQFFKTDSIIHYRIEIEGETLSALEFGENLSENDQLKKQVLFDEQHPINIKQTQFIDALENLGFVKTNIEHSEIVQIQSIFSLKKVTSIEPAYCGAIFRDVLVFYLNKQISGIAKLCFSCGHHVIVGTSLDRGNFGQDGDYQVLYKLLNLRE